MSLMHRYGRDYFKQDAGARSLSQLMIFNRYLKETDNDLEEALVLVQVDKDTFEYFERYEYCQLLKDIIQRFE